MQIRYSVLSGLLLALGVMASAADHDPADNTGLGLLTAPSMSPGHILRPSGLFLVPDPPAEGIVSVCTDVHWANVWMQEPGQHMIDGEWIRANTRVYHGLSASTFVGVLIPVMGRTGGFADPMIEGFHHAFGLNNAYRDNYPRNQSIVWVAENGATQTLARGDAWGLGDVSAFVVTQRKGGRAAPSVTLQCQVAVPTGDADEMHGLGEPSIGLSVLASKRLGSSAVILFGGAGFSYCSADESLGLRLRAEEYAGLLGFEYECAPSFSLIVQNLSSSPVTKDYVPFSEGCHELSAGFKWRVGAESTLEFSITENIATFRNSADIGAHVSFTQQL